VHMDKVMARKLLSEAQSPWQAVLPPQRRLIPGGTGEPTQDPQLSDFLPCLQMRCGPCVAWLLIFPENPEYQSLTQNLLCSTLARKSQPLVSPVVASGPVWETLSEFSFPHFIGVTSGPWLLRESGTIFQVVILKLSKKSWLACDPT
jgi:hypothetical protein